MGLVIAILLIIGIGCVATMLFFEHEEGWTISLLIPFGVAALCFAGVLSLLEINLNFFGETGYGANMLISLIALFVIQCIVWIARGKEARDDEKRRKQYESDEKAKVKSDMEGIRKSKKYIDFVNFIEKNTERIVRVKMEAGPRYTVYCGNPFIPMFVEDKRNQTWAFNNENPLEEHCFMKLEQGERHWTRTEEAALCQLFREYMDKQKSFKWGYDGNRDYYVKIMPTAEVKSKRPY